MTNEEIVSLIKQGIDVKANMELLYTQNKKFIYAIAKRYNGIAEIDDLMQEGYLGLHRAVELYDARQGNKFLTYAENWIQQSIKRYLETYRQAIRLPSHTQSLITKLKRYKDYVMRVEGREPTRGEILHYMGMDNKKLKTIEAAIYKGTIKSLDDAVPGIEDCAFGDTIADDSNIETDVINRLTGKELEQELWNTVEDVLKCQNNASKVLRYRFIKNLTLKVTGQKIGTTGDMARTIEAKALQKLRWNKDIKAIGQEYGIYAKKPIDWFSYVDDILGSTLMSNVN